MKIKELMALDLFRTCKLLTNEVGIDNEVDSAMVLEALDIENWAKKNQLILSSFYAFKELPINELHLFFQKMNQLEISGLLIKMDRLITIIPDWLIELCFQYQIPLIKVEQQVSYEKILLTIYEPLLNYQSRLLRTYYDVRQRFTKVERNHHSFENIMTTFYQLIHLPCRLDIPSLDIHLAFGEVIEDANVLSKEYIETNELTKNTYQKMKLFSQRDQSTTTALLSEITTPYAQQSILTVYLESEEIDESQLMVVENVIDIIYEHLQTEYLLKKERYTRLNNLADAILQNTPTSLDELNSLLDEAQMNTHRYYQGIAFSSQSPSSNELDKQIRKQLAHLRPKRIFFEHVSFTILLFNLKDPLNEINRQEIKNLFDFDRKEYHNLTFSMSCVKEKGELKEILLECLDTLRFNQTMRMNTVLSVNELGIFRHFMREEQAEQLAALIPSSLKKLHEEQPELFHTLLAFFKCGRHYKETADTLFLHVKTIRYRLKKIEQILNVDLTNPFQMVNYELGSYLLNARRTDLDE